MRSSQNGFGNKDRGVLFSQICFREFGRGVRGWAGFPCGLVVSELDWILKGSLFKSPLLRQWKFLQLPTYCFCHVGSKKTPALVKLYEVEGVGGRG